MIQDVLDQKEIAQRFAHFLRIHGNKTIMHPVAHEWRAAGKRFRLGHFVFVMRKNQIAAAAMEIKPATQIFMGHGAALDVPARPAGAPRAVPERFAGFGALPEGEIHGMTLAVIDFDARAGFHVIQTAAAQMAVCCKILNAEIYIAVHHISVTFLDQRPDHIDNFLHVARYSRIEVHPANIQAIHHFEIRLDIPVGQFIPGNSRFRRSVDNLVIHIRKVLDMSHRQALPFKIAVNDIPDDKWAGIADMRMIIGRHAADVNLDLPRFRRRKQFFFLG